MLIFIHQRFGCISRESSHVLQIASSVMHATNQGRTGHSSIAMLVAGAFTISKTKCLKKGLLKEFRGPFGFFCIECRRCLLIRRKGLLIPVRPCYKCLSTTSSLRNHLLSHNIEMAKRKAPSESSPTTAKKPKTSQLSVFYYLKRESLGELFLYQYIS
jgi:hypothetical protein